MQSEGAVAGSLLGTAVGDALGLPLEGLSPQRARKLFGEIGDEFGMRLLLGRGMVSDDTEHAILTLQAFVESNGDVTAFRNQLARGLKFWFLCLPPGTGLATAKSCLKLLQGVSPQRSGVLSAGNGPAMRAPILGVLLQDDAQLELDATTFELRGAQRKIKDAILVWNRNVSAQCFLADRCLDSWPAPRPATVLKWTA